VTRAPFLHKHGNLTSNLATRDIVLGTGMVHGMEASYARLEGTILPG
jgi:hypothetical protein